MFTLAASLASLLALDLEQIPPSGALDYFFSTLRTFAVPIAWAAWAALSVPAAWTGTFAPLDERERAVVRALQRLRHVHLPLAARMWLDDPTREPRPRIVSTRQEWWVRELSGRRVAWTLLIATLFFAGASLIVAVVVGQSLI